MAIAHTVLGGGDGLGHAGFVVSFTCRPHAIHMIRYHKMHLVSDIKHDDDGMHDIYIQFMPDVSVSAQCAASWKHDILHKCPTCFLVPC